MDDQAKADEKILTFDIPDEALERAASAEQRTLGHIALTPGITVRGHNNAPSAPTPAAWRYSPRSAAPHPW
jgi:hypothetical protein